MKERGVSRPWICHWASAQKLKLEGYYTDQEQNLAYV